jgi:hypothetical protein
VGQLRAVQRQLEIVAATWNVAHAHAGDISEDDARAAVQQLALLCDVLFPADQARFVEPLVECVEIGTGGLNVPLCAD